MVDTAGSAGNSHKFYVCANKLSDISVSEFSDSWDVTTIKFIKNLGLAGLWKIYFCFW